MSTETKTTTKKDTLPDIFARHEDTVTSNETAASRKVATRTVDVATTQPALYRPKEINESRQEALREEIERQYTHADTDSTLHEIFPLIIRTAHAMQEALELSEEDNIVRAQEKQTPGFLDPFGRVGNDIYARAAADREKIGEGEPPTAVMRLAEVRNRLNALNLEINGHNYRSPNDSNDSHLAMMRMDELASEKKRRGDPTPYKTTAEELEKIQANFQKERQQN